MNKKTILNLIAFILVVTGVLFKANHFPGANISIILGAAVMLTNLFLFGIKDNKEGGLSTGLNYFLIGTLTFFIVGIIFKIMHWPGAGVFVTTGYILGFALPIVLILQKNEFKISRQFIVTFFTYFILLISLFPNNPITQYFKGGEIMNTKVIVTNEPNFTTAY